MKKFKSFFIVFTLVLFTLSFFASADVGNTNNYSGGGGYSGGGSYSGGGGSVIFFGGTGDGGGGGNTSIIFPIIIVIIVIFIAVAKNKSKTNGTGFGIPKNFFPVVLDRTNEIESKIMVKDAAFSAEKMIAYTQEVFIKLQEAWTKRDWKTVRVFESEQLYNTHEAQLRRYGEQGRINVIDRINIAKSYICDYQDDGKTERVNIYFEVQMIDYIMDEKTNKVLNGNPNVRCFLKYNLEFIRASGLQTEDKQLSTTNCPNCGAPTEVTSAGQCDYCRSVITHGEHGWVLNKLEGINN